MPTDGKPAGPASYFPAIEKKYGQPILHWLDLTRSRAGFSHHFETRIERHAVETYHYTVVYLDASMHGEIPLDAQVRLRVEADVCCVSGKGAWQAARGRWYLLLPKAPLRSAGLTIGSAVEAAFRILSQDDVEIPDERDALLAKQERVHKAWPALSPGKQRGLAHLIASAKRPDTRAARLSGLEAVLPGKAPLPWDRAARSRAAET